jgi:hypothetical protein
MIPRKLGPRAPSQLDMMWYASRMTSGRKAAARKARVRKAPVQKLPEPDEGERDFTAESRAAWLNAPIDPESVHRPESGAALDRELAADAEARGLLLAVRTARRGVDEAERGLAGHVAAARAAGVSWHRVGLATGLTAEGARRRWGRA